MNERCAHVLLCSCASTSLVFVTYLHCRTWTLIPTRTWTPNSMATLYCPIAQTRTLISNRYPYLGRISVPRS